MARLGRVYTFRIQKWLEIVTAKRSKDVINHIFIILTSVDINKCQF